MKHLFAIIAVVCMAAPAFAQRTITKGATDETVELLIIDSTDGTPETGVVYNTSGIDLWYQRPGAAKTSITEATLSALTDAHSDGGFLAISNGVYRLDLPDAAFATGVSHVTIGGTVTGMIVRPVTVQLVDAQPVKITPFYGGDLQEDSGVYYFEFTATVNGTPAVLTSGAIQGSLDSGADAATGLMLNTIATGRYEVAINSDNAVFNGGGNLNLTLSAGTVNGIPVTNAKVGEVSVGRYASATSIIDDLLDRALTAVTAPPGSTPTVGEGFAWLVWLSQARIVTTETLRTVYGDDGTTPIAEAVLDVPAPGTFEKGEDAAP